MPSARGSASDSAGLSVTRPTKTRTVSRQDQTATVSSVMSILAMLLATQRCQPQDVDP